MTHYRKKKKSKSKSSTEVQKTYRGIEFNGKVLTLSDWAERYGINYNTLIRRLDMGWEFEEALTAPPRSARKRIRKPKQPLVKVYDTAHATPHAKAQ